MVHTILSLDVGIRNLAYCILEHSLPSINEKDSTTIYNEDFNEIIPNNIKKDDKCLNKDMKPKKTKKTKKPKKNVPRKEDISIKKWGIINLAECLQETGTCIERLKSHKICNKKASYVIKKPENITDGQTKYLCTRHYNSLDTKMQKKFKPIKKINCKKIPLLDIGKLAIQELSKLDYLLEVDEVVIENQPALIGPKMKSLQIILFSYFLMKGLMQESERITHIHTFSAKNKLKIYDGPEITDPNILKKKPYDQRKKLSIKYCEYMIKKQSDFLTFFLKHTKKDDLADCYLQGMYYLVNYYSF